MAAFGASESLLINVKQFVESFKPLLPRLSYTDKVEEYVLQEMNLEEHLGKDALLQELQIVCGFETLQDEDDDTAGEILTTFPSECNLSCVEYQRNEMKKRKSNSIYRNNIQRIMHYRFDDGPYKHQLLSKQNTAVLEEPHALLSVRIYRPFFASRRLGAQQELQVIGSNCLTELKDKIMCLNDTAYLHECSETPDAPKTLIAKDHFPSSYLFIEDVFYNDRRHPDSKDNSQCVIEWASKTTRGLGPYTSARMEETTFEDLNICIGKPYLYCHQGECEHIVVFTDLRILHPDECQDLTKYPLLTGLNKKKRIMCRVCLTYSAVWVTRESLLSPEDPCFFCDVCFKALQYDKDGKKVGDFKAYPLHLTSFEEL